MWRRRCGFAAKAAVLVWSPRLSARFPTVQGVQASALWFRAPGRVEVGPVDLPAVGPGEVLVRTMWSGISSGTELLAYRGELPPDLVLDESLAMAGSFTYPFRYGYSCVGRVERSSSDLDEGAIVVALAPHQDRVVVPSGDVVVLPEVDLRHATLFPLVETALQISLDAGAVAHRPVVVTGLGVVGVLTAVLLQRQGADVLAADPSDARRHLARSLGLAAVAPDELAAAVGPAGSPLLIEVSGRPEALAAGLELLAHEGTALVASWYGTKPASLPLGGAFHRRRLTIRSTQVSTIPAALAAQWSVARRREVAAGLLGALPLGALATHEFAFDEAPAAFAALDRGEEGLLHAALRYP